ncbi:hypothetical protein ABZ702_16045 [Streptomyces cyaneofuscatus]|uniref:hypothetical protein n=1 Tax=Streptomyces cyaneofuscatus TaxID=66883 RepID=UPI0033E8C348
MRFRFSFAMFGVAAALAFLVSCGSPPAEPDAISSEGVKNSDPLQPEKPTSLSLPEVELKKLTAVQPTKGALDAAGSFPVKPGELWIKLNCTGDGIVTVDVQPLVEFDIPCTEGEINQTENQLNLVKAREITLKVSAPEKVGWSLLAEQ